MALTPEQAQAILRGTLTQQPSQIPVTDMTPEVAARMLHTAGISLEAPQVSVSSPVTDNMIGAFGEGIKRGIKDLGEGAQQMRLEMGENHPVLRDLLMANPMTAPIAGLSMGVAKGASEAYKRRANKEISAYEKRTANHPYASGIGRLTGNIITGLPLGGMEDIAAISGRPLLSRALGGAGTGFLYGTTSYDPSGTDVGRLARGVLGGIIGGAIPASWHGAKTFWKWLRNPPKLIDDPAVLKEAARRVGEAQEIGLPGLPAGAATRDPTIQAREQELLRAPTRVAQTFRDAHKEISDKIHEIANDMVDRIGGKPLVSKILGGDIQDAMLSTKGSARGNISKMYEVAENAPGGDASLDRDGILHKAADLLDHVPDLKFGSAIQKTLGKLSKAGKNIFITPTKQAQSFDSPFTIREANKFIRTINKTMRGTFDPSHRFALGKLKSSVFDSIDELADDPDNPARSLFNLARHIRRNLADVYDQKDIVGTLTKMKGTTTRYINPEDVMDRIFGRRNKITDIEKVEKALKYELPFDDFVKETKKVNPTADLGEIHDEYTNKILPQEARNKQLWDDLRTTKFNDLIQKSTVILNGTPVLSYKLITKNIKQLGKESLDKILGNKEVSAKFYKLINTMDSLQNQKPSKVVSDKAVKTINKLSSGIFGSIGGEESRLGAFIHKPLGMLVNLIKNINDAQWIKANLHLGIQNKTHFDEVMKEDPSLVLQIEQKLKQLPALTRMMRTAGTITSAAPIEQPET